MAWTLRVRGPSGQATLSGVDPSMTIAAFQALLLDKSGVAPDRQELLGGFPPRVLQLPADAASAPVSSLAGLGNGETLTVRELPAAAAVPVVVPSQPDAAVASGIPADIVEDEDADLAAAIAASLADAQQPASSSHPAPTRAAPAAAVAPTASGSEFSGGRAVSNAVQPPLGPGGAAPTHIETPDGSAVTRRIIDSDNSCLFNAVGYVMEHSRSRAPELRRVIADAVRADPVQYNDGFLGKDNAEYCTWICQSDKWGGAIELFILAKHYQREIAAYDIQTKRMDVYGQGEGYSERVMLIYDGLHYDALAVAAFAGAPEELDVTIFPPDSSDAVHISAAAEQLVAAAHAARQFTDTSNFTLRCGVCQIGLKGEKEAVAHAKDTGHSNFSEY